MDHCVNENYFVGSSCTTDIGRWSTKMDNCAANNILGHICALVLEINCGRVCCLVDSGSNGSAQHALDKECRRRQNVVLDSNSWLSSFHLLLLIKRYRE